jgi:glycosyltransferase A (GT-A) superfamily protein (DUF2064 family)
MERLLLVAGADRSVLIGSDLPSVRAAHIADAFDVLAHRDAVFGPAEDGGFWLAGLKPVPRIGRVFGHVRWSGPHALADTLRNMGHRQAGFAATLSDVDNRRDYELVAGEGLCVTLSPRPGEKGAVVSRLR